MTRLLLDSSAYIAFKKKHPEVIETLPQAEEIWDKNRDILNFLMSQGAGAEVTENAWPCRGSDR